MVFGVVKPDGDFMPPFIFLHDFTFNTVTNIKGLEKVVQL